MESTNFKLSLLSVNGINVHLVDAGDNNKQPVLLLNACEENAEYVANSIDNFIRNE